MKSYWTPVRVNEDGTEAIERAPVCGMEREAATEWARAAYGLDAGIERDDVRGDVVWVGEQ